MFLVVQNIIYWFFPELVYQHRSSVLYLQDLYIYPYSVESNGFSVGEGRVVAPTFHQEDASACCLSTRSTEPLPPPLCMV